MAIGILLVGHIVWYLQIGSLFLGYSVFCMGVYHKNLSLFLTLKLAHVGNFRQYDIYDAMQPPLSCPHTAELC